MNAMAKRVVLPAVLAALVITGCGGNSKNTGSSAVNAATPAGAGSSASSSTPEAFDLAGVCPATVTLQLDWQPEASYGGWWSLLGDGYTFDTKLKRVKGPLVAQGHDTGVDLEIRIGGPGIGFQPVSSAMYSDSSITIGQVATDEAIQFSAKQPMTTILAPMDISPLGLMWDPATYPNVQSIADLGKSDAKILYNEAAGSYPIDYLTGIGVLKKSQLDGSYDGSPAAFVAAGGKAALQGFAGSEPYRYEHDVKAWGKPSKFETYYDTGYQPYIAAAAIRSGDKEKLTPCLKRLVPIMQQSQVDFMKSPDRGISIIVEAADKYKTGWSYSDGNARFALQKMTELKLVGNGTNKAVGDFDPARVQKVIDVVTPILTAEHKAPKPGLTVEDVATNDFIDPSIGFAP
ncbi:ABC transporter substrate-binding protein [Kribbella sp. NPDC004536]|uniref:ABC transporter substrate-binding protein n=1 Tax=Kribbella sp. NPDC004536 TaxID=3364106 RepID=UPI0036D07227